MPSFSDLLADGVLLADGATGTNYQDMGMQPGIAPEEWVFDAPERVAELHRRFAQAGSQLVLTCTFGGSPVRLTDGPLAGRARELNSRAAELAREAVGDGVLVAGSIGPSGQLVEPLFSLEEALWAIEAARSVSDLPLVASFSFDQGTRTMMGLSPSQVIEATEPLGLAAVGANCGRSLQDMAAVLAEFTSTGTTTPLWIKPNAGVPQVTAEGVRYPETPE